MSHLARIRPVLFLALLALSAVPASAATSQYQILLNADNNQNSGCDVSTVAGTFGGVEHILLTTVETTGPASAMVTRIERSVCVTPATDTFGPLILVDDTDRPVGIGNGTDGFNVVETYFPGSILAGNKPPVIRLGVTSSNGGGAQDAMLTARPNTGQPIQKVLAAILDVPTVSEWGLILLGLLLAAAAVTMLRRRSATALLLALALLGAAGVAWAAVYDLNGQTIAEWTPSDLLGEDAAGDAPASVDLRALFGAFDQTNNRLVFRLDVSLEFVTAPVAEDDAYTTTQNTVLNVAAPGVLDNDDGTALTVTPQAAAPTTQGGTVTVNADGSFSYTPPAGFVSPPADSFTYTATNSAGSDTATVTISVTDINEAPSFTKGADQTVLEDAGPQTVDPWATAISPGPASEAGQTVTFNVTNNSNPGLFSAGPAISPTGALTYTPAANANGTATITITLQDNGGTAGGGVDTSAAQTFVINVTAVNDVPVFTVGPNQTVAEDSGAQTVDPWATGISAGPADESGQTLTFNVTNNTNPGLFSVAPAVSPTGVLTYTVEPNTTGTATITLTLSDDGGTANGGVDTSAGQDFTITVSDINDAPSFTKGGDQTVLEDAGPQTVNPWATAISAGAGEGSQTLTFNVTNNTNPGLFSAGPAVSAAGVLTFTPAANANGTATITLTLSDDGGTAGGGVDTSPAETFVINVTAVNDAPSFTKGADQAVGEDAGPQTVNPWATAILAGPTDESGQTLSFNVTGNTNPGLFSVAPAVSAAGVLTYTPMANTSGTATITLNLSDDGGTANGGVDTSAAQTFVINVNDVNDAPSFTKGPDQTVLEDAGPQTVNPWATAISAGPGETQTLAFNVTGNTNPTLFSAGPAVSAAGVLTFTPAANANGTATITLTLSDDGGTAGGGVDTSPAQTFVINVTAVNDAPSFTKGADPSVLEDAGPQTVNPWATAISAGPTDESGQTLSFNVTGNTNPGLFAVAPAVSAAGVLTYTPMANTSGTATITLNLSDDGGTANGGVDTSAAQMFTITVADINDPPSFTKGADVTVNEDAGAQSVNPWATAISAGPGEVQTLSFNVTNNTNPGLFSAGPAISSTGELTFTPAADAFGTATITLTLSDDGGTANGGVDTSAAQTFVITVNSVNDVPSFAKGADQAVFEDAGPQTVNPWATAISAGPANESGQTLSFNLSNTNPGLFSAGPAVSSTGVLTYTPTANTAGTATVTLTISDNGGTANGGVDTSVSQSFVITVNGINDAPSFVKGPDVTVDEDSGPQTVNPWATAILAGPPDESGQTVMFNVSSDNPGLFSAGPAVSSTGVLTFTSAPNAFGSATVTISLQDDGGTANGGVDTSAAQMFVITVNPVNDAPTLTNNPITYTTAGNTQLHVAGGTLPGVASIADGQSATAKAQPTDIDGPVAPTIVANSGSSANGGSFTMNADGSFTYVPPVGFTGTDSFTYQVTDTVTPTLGTVNITVSEMVWYVRDVVDGDNPAGGDGRSNNAFETLAGAEAASGANHIIYVFRGNTGTTALNGGIDLKNGQKLWGQGIDLVVPGFGTPLVTATTQPRITNTVDVPAQEDNGVNVAATVGSLTNVEIRGLDISGLDNAIDVTATGANNAGVTIRDNTISGAALQGIDVNANSTGTVTLAVHDNTLTASGTALDATRTAGTLVITAFDDNVVTGNTGGSGLVVNTATFDATPGGALNPVSGGTTVIGASGNPVGGAGLVLNTVIGALDFTDLDVFSGGGAGVNIVGTGAFTGAAGTRVTVGAGVSIIESAGGPGVSASTATIDFQLSSLTVNSSPTTGVSLVNVSDATVAPLAAVFSAGSGSSISNVTGTDFDVDGGNGTITYGGSITNTAGRSVSVRNRTGDSVTFTNTSTINDTGTGILVDSNAAGAVTDFLGTLTLSTGTNAAFTATSGGRLRVMGAANTVAATTGTALNVTSTTIGTGSGAPETGLRFRSVSAGTAASGPANGIVLNNTGTLGSLTVTGTGGAGTGGTIQRTTSHGVSLTNTQSPSFTSMSLQNTGGSGVKGTQVTNFTFVNGSISNSGTALAAGDSNIAFNTSATTTENNLSGVVTITGNTLTNAYYHGVDILNYDGSLTDVTISGNTLTSSTVAASSQGSAIRLIAFGSATTAASVTRATIANNVISNFPTGDGIQVQGGNAAVGGPATTLGVAAHATNIIAITGNRVAGQSAANKLGGNGIVAALRGSGQGNFDLSSNGTVANPITNVAGIGIVTSVFGPMNVTTNMTNNVIVANNTFGSQGILAGIDNHFGLTDAGTLTATINNNTVSGTDGNGIYALARNSSATLRAKIQNNTVAAPLGGVRPGIRVDSGSASGNTTVCLNISGNTSAGSGGSQGLGLRKQGTVPATNTYGVNGMAATSSPGVEAYVDGLNPAGNGTLLISGTSGFTNCSLP
jgi:hypothetical protein